MPFKDQEKEALFKKQWYLKNKAKISADAKSKYKNDPKFRAATKKRSADYYHSNPQEINKAKFDYNKEYRGKHKEQYNAASRRWRYKNFENFLKTKITSAKRNDKIFERDFDIDQQHICDVFAAQDGRCAVTGIKMTHDVGDLKSATIDRIDNSKGHIKGNVQLVCMFYNHGKKINSDQEGRDIVDLIKNEITPDEWFEKAGIGAH